jgi:nicotinamidase-related amidase
MSGSGHGGHLYRAAGTTGWGFPPSRTALLVIDPVNDFLSEGGAGWDLTEGTVTKHDVVGHLRQVIGLAHESGIPVLYAPMAFVEQDYADRELHRRSGINRLMFERRMFLVGSWGADFHPELRPTTMWSCVRTSSTRSWRPTSRTTSIGSAPSTS